MSSKMNEVKAELEQKKTLYEQFCNEIEAQLLELIRQESIVLAVPIESRIKSWTSILNKCTRREVTPKALEEIGDIAGLRIVFLFRRDQTKVCKIISDNFEVLKMEDAQDRLSVDQFGYGSVHFEVKPKEEWFSLPTLRRLRGLQAEIQVRTASQHIWAAASHTLQYKRESDIPKPLRRAINRVAALLEMVDLEFEHLLADRITYVAQLDRVSGEEPLNSDIVQKILAEELPPQNADETIEDFSDLLDDLLTFNIHTAISLRELIKKHRNKILTAEAAAVEDIRKRKNKSFYHYSPERVAKGVFYTHVGLAREALGTEFGSKFKDHIRRKAEIK